MGNPLRPGVFDANAASWGLYGAVRGIWRALEIAERNGLRASVMTNGVLAEQWPDTVRAIHRGGHEVVAHSYGMDVIPVYLDEGAQRENIRRTIGLIADVTGEAPLGWISRSLGSRADIAGQARRQRGPAFATGDPVDPPRPVIPPSAALPRRRRPPCPAT